MRLSCDQVKTQPSAACSPNLTPPELFLPPQVPGVPKQPKKPRRYQGCSEASAVQVCRLPLSVCRAAAEATIRRAKQCIERNGGPYQTCAWRGSVRPKRGSYQTCPWRGSVRPPLSTAVRLDFDRQQSKSRRTKYL